MQKSTNLTHNFTTVESQKHKISLAASHLRAQKNNSSCTQTSFKNNFIIMKPREVKTRACPSKERNPSKMVFEQVGKFNCTLNTSQKSS